MEPQNSQYPPPVDPRYLNRYPGARVQPMPTSSGDTRNDSFNNQEPSAAQHETQRPPINPQRVKSPPVQRKPVGSAATAQRNTFIRTTSQDSTTYGHLPPIQQQQQPLASQPAVSLPMRQAHSRGQSEPLQLPPTFTASDYNDLSDLTPKPGDVVFASEELETHEKLQYHHNWDEPEEDVAPPPKGLHERGASIPPEASTALSGDGFKLQKRPVSTHTPTASDHVRGRSLTPLGNSSNTSLSPAGRHARSVSAGRSPDSRPTSYVDLLNTSYSQQFAQQNHTLDNAKLRTAVGSNASLLDTRKTLEMYRANIKKTNDPAITYEFAIFMINAAQDAAWADQNPDIDSNAAVQGLSGAKAQAELFQEARQILQRLADRSYVFAQYYLADGYASGLFNKGREDHERAFPLFLSAGKHGHAESSYRAALCYEFGWGARRDYAKAVQFYRQAASKNHPGAACRLGMAYLSGDLGLSGRDRDGIKWLKRATESADYQHNVAPYELGVMHITGYGDDVFKDESYAAQLFTQAAELGHAEASLRMGEAYEHGLLTCPKDPALSIHFYTAAAEAGLPKAMMALCAWYMVGAEPVLEKDEREAYEWAKRAAENNFPKAEYAVGYFTEMGIGCRRDPLEANVWYVRAADRGEERAKQRLAIIRAAETGEQPNLKGLKAPKSLGKKKSMNANANANTAPEDKDEKDCIVM